MNRKRSRRQRGFTIIECLISIAILAISLTGVLAALAYDAFSAEQGSNYVFAVNYSRKIMDLLQSNQIDPQLAAISQNTSTPPSISSPTSNDGTTWHELDGTVGKPDYTYLHFAGQSLDTFWGPLGSNERKRFDTEKGKYGVNICWYRENPNNDIDEKTAYRNLLVNLIVTTRWHVRRGFRSVQLRSTYVAAAG